MKRNNFLLLSFASITFIMCACENEPNNPNNPYSVYQKEYRTHGTESMDEYLGHLTSYGIIQFDNPKNGSYNSFSQTYDDNGYAVGGIENVNYTPPTYRQKGQLVIVDYGKQNFDTLISYGDSVVGKWDTYYYYGSSIKESVNYSLPSVQTIGTISITDSSAICICKLLSNGNDSTTEYGIMIYNEWGYDAYKEPTFIKGDTCYITGLDCGSTYYYYAYAKNRMGESEGWKEHFKTTGPTYVLYVDPYEYDAKVQVHVGVENGMLTEYGYCYATHSLPTISDRRVDVTSTSGLYITDLDIETYYFIRGYAKIDGQIRYGGQITFYTKTWEPTQAPGEAVDLGLGVLWADRNIEASSRTDQGIGFTWGECKPKWSSVETHRKHYDADAHCYTKYTTKGENLELEDDAAHYCWGGKWRTPTRQEINALIYGCNVQYGTCDGQSGWIFTSKSNGNSIFIPCYRSLGMIDRYWSATVGDTDIEKAWGFDTDVNSSYSAPNMYEFKRTSQLLIRPVCDR